MAKMREILKTLIPDMQLSPALFWVGVAMSVDFALCLILMMLRGDGRRHRRADQASPDWEGRHYGLLAWRRCSPAHHCPPSGRRQEPGLSQPPSRAMDGTRDRRGMAQEPLSQ
jgi:hypothetical protein